VLAGVPGIAANGSNRVGILTSNISTYLSFRREGVSIDSSRLLPIIPPALVGSMVGAFGISELTDETFERAFGLLMIPLIILTIRKPKVNTDASPWPIAITTAVFFVIGVYAGAVRLSIGGWIGAKFAVRGGEQWIRAVMIAAALALAGRLIGLY